MMHIDASLDVLSEMADALETWISMVKENQPTTPELADWLINPPLDWPAEKMDQHVACMAVMLATALQKLAADD